MSVCSEISLVILGNVNMLALSAIHSLISLKFSSAMKNSPLITVLCYKRRRSCLLNMVKHIDEIVARPDREESYSKLIASNFLPCLEDALILGVFGVQTRSPYLCTAV